MAMLRFGSRYMIVLDGVPKIMTCGYDARRSSNLGIKKKFYFFKNRPILLFMRFCPLFRHNQILKNHGWIWGHRSGPLRATKSRGQCEFIFRQQDNCVSFYDDY
jgi:hypothetical protein